VLAARARQLPDRLAAVLDRIDWDGAVGRIELGPLERAEAGALLGQPVDAVLADGMYQESGGNPFYLEQLAGALQLPATASNPGQSRLAAWMYRRLWWVHCSKSSGC
jgi:hypothetical protein